MEQLKRIGTVILEGIYTVNDFINDLVWGPLMIVLLIGTGIYLTVRLGWPQIRRIREINWATFGKVFGKVKSEGEGTITSQKAGWSSIACVVGTGNITGVATAVATGGPGALFWMWLSAFFGMATKFAEIVLGIYFREKDGRGEYVGGAMYYIYKGLKSKWLAYAFCVCAILSYMVCGAIVDTNSICLGLQAQWNIAPWISGLLMAFLTGIVILGGVTRIGDVCEWLTPLMSIAYIAAGIAVLILNIGSVPAAFASIFTSAFTPAGATGGFVGATVSQMISVGLARGLNSNEAGMGTSPTLNCAAQVSDPVEQGYWGILEVFLDTIIICTITGLVIVISGQWITGISGTELAMKAFKQLLPGTFGGFFIMAATFLFGYSCLITSCYICEVAYSFMRRGKSVTPVRWIWIVFIEVGALGGLEFVWDLADTANGLLAIPNLISLVLLTPLLVKLVKGREPSSRLK